MDFKENRACRRLAGGMKSDMRTKQRIPFVPSCRKPETSVAPQDNTLSEATEAILQLPAVPTVREVASLKAANLESALSGFLAERYEFRFNVLTEPRFRHLSDERGRGPSSPATERTWNTIVSVVHRHGIDCWDRDVARMVHTPQTAGEPPSFRTVFPTASGMGRTRPPDDLAVRGLQWSLWIQSSFHRWIWDWPHIGPDSLDGCMHTAPASSSRRTRTSESPPSACTLSATTVAGLLHPTAWTSLSRQGGTTAH